MIKFIKRLFVKKFDYKKEYFKLLDLHVELMKEHKNTCIKQDMQRKNTKGLNTLIKNR